MWKQKFWEKKIILKSIRKQNHMKNDKKTTILKSKIIWKLFEFECSENDGNTYSAVKSTLEKIWKVLEIWKSGSSWSVGEEKRIPPFSRPSSMNWTTSLKWRAMFVCGTSSSFSPLYLIPKGLRYHLVGIHTTAQPATTDHKAFVWQDQKQTFYNSHRTGRNPHL